jgi:hypothetical protein
MRWAVILLHPVQTILARELNLFRYRQRFDVEDIFIISVFAIYNGDDQG